MKALITGSEGFVGMHLCAEFEENGYEVVRCDITENDNTVLMDIMRINDVKRILEQYKPSILINLAGQANVGLSWKKPQRTVEINTIGTINILEAVREINPSIRVVVMGSSDEYGQLKDKGRNITEESPVNPMNPYAISKVAQELFAKLYVSNYNLNVCMVRQFNLGGAGQAKGFLISDFASGIVEIEAGLRNNLAVGNLESARDFTHVKDACRAIRLIAEKGYPGEIYNISSGETHTVREILYKLISMAKVPVEIHVDSARMRPSDTPVICGNHDKITEHTGWMPEIGLEEILEEELSYWRKQLISTPQ